MKFLLLIIPVLTGCAQKSDFAADEILSEDLWVEIEDYQNWNQMADWEGVVPSESTHGDSAYAALNNSEPVPEGGIIVKDGYNDEDGTDQKAITAMQKIEGYNPDAGDWFWAAYGVDGSVSTSGKADFCISCHSSGEDYVVFVGLDPQ
jgi:hypothetical protein